MSYLVPDDAWSEYQADLYQQEQAEREAVEEDARREAEREEQRQHDEFMAAQAEEQARLDAEYQQMVQDAILEEQERERQRYEEMQAAQYEVEQRAYEEQQQQLEEYESPEPAPENDWLGFGPPPGEEGSLIPQQEEEPYAFEQPDDDAALLDDVFSEWESSYEQPVQEQESIYEAEPYEPPVTTLDDIDDSIEYEGQRYPILSQAGGEWGTDVNFGAQGVAPVEESIPEPVIPEPEPEPVYTPPYEEILDEVLPPQQDYGEPMRTETRASQPAPPTPPVQGTEELPPGHSVDDGHDHSDIGQTVAGQPPSGVGSTGWAFPVQGYGGQVQLHWGSHRGAADLFAPAGTPVVAARGGRVTGAGFNAIGGNYVMIRGDDGNEYYYAHLDRAPAVRSGQQVEAGAYLGGVGDTGNARGTGAHLHFGAGRSILNGTGPAGGAGSDFDAVGMLRATLTGGGRPAGRDEHTPGVTTAPAAQIPASADNDLVAYARRAAERAGIDVNLFLRQITQESSWNPNAGSPAGAQGIAQIVPRFHPGVDPWDPFASLDYAANLMKSHLNQYGGDIRMALAAYNGGGGAVQRLRAGTPYQETQQYLNRILGGGAMNIPGSVPFGEPSAEAPIGVASGQITPGPSDSSSPWDSLRMTSEDAIEELRRRGGEFAQEIGLAAGQVGDVLGAIGRATENPDPRQRRYSPEWNEAFMQQFQSGQSPLGNLASPEGALSAAIGPDLMGQLPDAGQIRRPLELIPGLQEADEARRTQFGPLSLTPLDVAEGIGNIAMPLGFEGIGARAAGAAGRVGRDALSALDPPARQIDEIAGALNPQGAFRSGLGPDFGRGIPDDVEVWDPMDGGFRAAPDRSGPAAVRGTGDDIIPDLSQEVQGVQKVRTADEARAILENLSPEVRHRLPNLTSEQIGDDLVATMVRHAEDHGPAFDAELTEVKRHTDTLAKAKLLRMTEQEFLNSPAKMWNPEEITAYRMTRNQAVQNLNDELAQIPDVTKLPEADQVRLADELVDVLRLEVGARGASRRAGQTLNALKIKLTEADQTTYGLKDLEDARVALKDAEDLAGIHDARVEKVKNVRMNLEKIWRWPQEDEVAPAARTEAQRIRDEILADWQQRRAELAAPGKEATARERAFFRQQEKVIEEEGVAIARLQKYFARMDAYDAAEAERLGKREEAAAFRQKWADAAAEPPTRLDLTGARVADQAVQAANRKALQEFDRALREAKRFDTREANFARYGQATPPKTFAEQEAARAKRAARVEGPQEHMARIRKENDRALAAEWKKYEAIERAEARRVAREANAARRRLENQQLKDTRLQHRKEQHMSAVLEKMTGMAPTSELLQSYQKMVQANDPIATEKFLRSLVDPGWWSRLETLRYSSLLSGISTNTNQLLGNLSNLGINVATRPLAAAFDTKMTGSAQRELAEQFGNNVPKHLEELGVKTRYAEESPEEIKGAINSVALGIENMKTVLKTGIPSTGTKLDRPARGFGAEHLIGPGKAASAIDAFAEGPLRIFMAGDEFVRGMAKGGSARVLATRKAMAEGYRTPEGGTPEIRIEEIMENLTDHPELTDEADKMAARTVLQEHRDWVEGWVGAVYGTPPKAHLATILGPWFIRTPLNIIHQGVELSPAGWAIAYTKARKAGELMQEAVTNPDAAVQAEKAVEALMARGDAVDTMARATAGSAVTAGSIMLFSLGILTGSRPPQEGERPPGWQPWSLKIGDHYFSLSNIGPLAIPAVTGAIMAEAWSTGRVTDITAIPEFVSNQVFLRHFAELVGAVKDKGWGRGETYVEQMARQVVPYSGFNRSVQQILGMAERDPHGALEVWKSYVPLLGGEVEPRRDIIGREIPTEGLLGAVSPVRMTSDRDTPALRAMREAGVNPTRPGREIQGEKLSTQAYGQYQERAGRNQEALINDLLARGAPPTADEIRRAVGTGREDVREAAGYFDRDPTQPWKYRGVEDVRREKEIDDAVARVSEWRASKGRLPPPPAAIIALGQRYSNASLRTPAYKRWANEQTQTNRTRRADTRRMEDRLRELNPDYAEFLPQR